jgi:hypothetical protein
MPFIPPTPDDIAHVLEVIHPRSRPPCSARYRRHFRKWKLRGFSRSGLCATAQQTIDTKTKTAPPLCSESNGGYR